MNAQGTKIHTFALNETSQEGNPRGEQEGGVIAEVRPGVVARLIVPPAVEQLEVA